MPRRALRSYPTTYATDLTDAQWAVIALLDAAPSPNGGRPTESGTLDCLGGTQSLGATTTTAIQNQAKPFFILVQSQCS